MAFRALQTASEGIQFTAIATDNSASPEHSSPMKNSSWSGTNYRKVLRLVGGILGIVSGVFGTGAAISTLFFGGIGAAFGGEGAGLVIALGWFGLLASFVTIVAGSVCIAMDSKIPSFVLIGSAILGSIFGGALVEICMILAQAGGILILFGISRPPENIVSSGLISETVDPYYRNIFKDIEAGNRPPINWYAFLGTCIWYFVKGMTEKAFVYLAAGSIIVEVIGLIFSAKAITALGAGIAGFYGGIANWDYYLYKVHGQTFFTSYWTAGISRKFEFPRDLPKKL